jgi:hypothetical membrane protein
MEPRTTRAEVTKWAALCGAALVLIDVAFTLWLAALNPGYSHWRQLISELGEPGRPFAWLFAVWSVLYGILFALFSVGLLKSLGRQPAARWGGLALLLFAAGNAVGGMFACDPGCAGHTLSAKMHIIVGAINLTSIFIGPFFLAPAMAAIPAWRNFRWPTFVVGCCLGIFGLWLGLTYFVGATSSSAGAIQRALMIVLYVWIAALSVRLWRPEENRPA